MMLRPWMLAFAALGVFSQTALGQPLADQNFEVTKLYGKPVTYQQSPSLAFGLDGKVRGHGGCNNYGGEFSATSTTRSMRAKRTAKPRAMRVWTLRIRNISSTRMYCGPGSAVESRFFDALQSARRYVLKNGTLTIYGARGRAPLVQLTKVAM